MAGAFRAQPGGLIALLSQAQLASLRAVADGALKSLPEHHLRRLLDLGLIVESADGLAATALGRERLIADK